MHMSLNGPEIYQVDQFTARRKVFKLFGAGFTLLSLDGRVLAASAQKGFRLKEDIRVHEGADDGPELLTIQADRIIDFSAAYRVVDSISGEVIGSLRRKGWSSMFRDSWEILDAEGVVRGKVSEDSGWKAAPGLSDRGRRADRRDDDPELQPVLPKVRRRPERGRGWTASSPARGGHGDPPACYRRAAKLMEAATDGHGSNCKEFYPCPVRA